MTAPSPFRPPRPLVPVASIQGSLALDLGPQLDPPQVVAPPGSPGGDVVPIDRGARRAAEQWVHRYAQAAVEIVCGDRPVSQLLRWSSPTVHADLSRRAQLAARASRRDPLQGRPRRVTTRPQVASARTCFVSREAVEVSVHVRYGQRSRALAARFERVDERWICVALEFA